MAPEGWNTIETDWQCRPNYIQSVEPLSDTSGQTIKESSVYISGDDISGF